MKPETYKRLFKRYGAVPSLGVYVSKTNSLVVPALKSMAKECAACAVGIRVIAKLKSVEAARERVISAVEDGGSTRNVLSELAGLSDSFVFGLDKGWESSIHGDDHPLAEPSPTASRDFRAGWAEGRAAAKACKPTYMWLIGRPDGGK